MTQSPALLANAPISLVTAQTLAEFPVNTFLESIAVSADNTLFFTNHYEGKVMCIGADGIPRIFATIEGKATGLAFVPDGHLLLTGWDDRNTCAIWKISSQGTVEVLASLPDAIFLNGLTRLTDRVYLVADSYRGAIWELSLDRGTARIWLEHPWLARANPENEFPAVNGLKIFENVLYASNTQNQQMVKVPIQSDLQPGEPEIFVSDVNIDDFAFDKVGNLYGTTHVFNSVVKIAPDGSITTIAQAAQGIVGSTAAAFGAGVHSADLYVVTNGGMSFPPPTGVETAKVVRLNVGQAGLKL
jgi:WD40 repeat protein